LALVGSISAVQINRDPLLTWEATEPATHPINYPVPNFGVDHDIKTSLKNSEAWTPVKDADGKWEVPAASIEFKLLQTGAKRIPNGSNLETSSDLRREPLLAKDASPLLIHQKPAYADHPVDYFVPNFG